eukprot:TRINITY_DN573_c0_g1_i2.p1 TRINITY_DN573_c0_g1~~TRINITY_DN573_c0_g1_i2.p1  ORF type:complete len:351 (+),score=43.98 TRINITY_DN573_c0_g1_i2:150-1202(+)
MNPHADIEDDGFADVEVVPDNNGDDESAPIPPDMCPNLDKFLKFNLQGCAAKHPHLAKVLCAAYERDCLQRSRVWFASRAGLVTSTTLAVHAQTTVRRLAFGLFDVKVKNFENKLRQDLRPPSAAAADSIRLELRAVYGVAGFIQCGRDDRTPPVVVHSPPILRGGCGCCATSPDAIIIAGNDVWFVETKVPGGVPPNLLQKINDTRTTFAANPRTEAKRFGNWFHPCSHHRRTGLSWWNANVPPPYAAQPRGVILATFDKRLMYISGWIRFEPPAEETARLQGLHDQFSARVKTGRAANADTLGLLNDRARAHQHARCSDDVQCLRWEPVERHPTEADRDPNPVDPSGR